MEAVTAVPASGARADYLSAEQRRRCADLTRRDIEAINARLSVPALRMPTQQSTFADRAFLPSVAQVPSEAVAAAMSRLAILLAAQVPDGKVERKKRLRGRPEAASDDEDSARRRMADPQPTAEHEKPSRDEKRAARKARKAQAAAPPA